MTAAARIPRIHRFDTRPARRRLLSAAALGTSLFLAAPAGASAADVRFGKIVVATPVARHQTVLSGALLEGQDALAVVSVYVDGTRRLRLLGAQRGWQVAHEATLKRTVRFVDVANIGGIDRLLQYESGRMTWYDPETGHEHAIGTFETRFRAPAPGRMAVVDISRDLNGDGLDDIVLPDVDGFWVVTQNTDGTFSDAAKLGPAEPFRNHRIGNLDLEEPGLDPDMRYGDVGITPFTADWYLGRVHTMDHNLDGRVDLVFWNDDHFDVHYQNEQGTFAVEPVIVTTDVAIDSDGAYSRVFEFVDDGVGAILFGLGKKSSRTVVHGFLDMNGDGLDDLVTMTTSGRSVTRQKSEFSVFYGAASPAGVAFTPPASTTLRPRGKAGAMQSWGYSSLWFEDFDGDGDTDALFRNVNVGLGGMTRALAGKSVSINLEYFRMQDGVYPAKSGVKHKVRPTIRVFGGGGPFFPAVLLGDVNGDGLQDLVYGKNRELLLVHPGIPGSDGFAETPVEVSVSLPADERDIRLVDLNGDGKQDVLILHRSDDEPMRMTLLIAE